MTANAKQSVRIDIISDVVCPWCYLGKARLEAALKGLPNVDADIHWRPYQLDPTIPRTGVDRKAYMAAKFGPGPGLAEAHSRLTAFGKELGIVFAFDTILVSPNTMNAHRLIRWAAQAGPGIQNKTVDLLFQAYFEGGKDIGDVAVLTEVAGSAGMDPDIIATLLSTDAEEAGVIGEIAQAKQLGISGVPCFIINQKYAVSGAQTPEILAETISSALT